MSEAADQHARYNPLHSGCPSPCPMAAPAKYDNYDSLPRWVHSTNAQNYPSGSVFGWADARSPTGFLSGIVIESDPLTLRVLVDRIALGVIVQSPVGGSSKWPIR